MSNTKKITEAIIAQGILPLYFNPSEEISLDVLKAIYKAGIKAVEYTNRGEAALANFTKMVTLRNAEMPDYSWAWVLSKYAACVRLYGCRCRLPGDPGFVPM
jgi:hypothetical protein